ncbi:DUF222 domain-containing protein [Luteimicrobium sp. NPDC057192]|uniref:HNH endonuclease signature motif containing protein n=1 Tax=Luteimicrobium sp. NPDC057192 TaxID=3346042 RepID=UPI00362636DD
MFESERAEAPPRDALCTTPLAARLASPARGREASVLEVAFAHLIARLVGLASPSEPADDRADAPEGAADGELADRIDPLPAPPLDVPDLAARLARLEPSEVGDDALVDAVVAWQRVASWAAAQQAVVIDELLARGGSSSRAAEAVVHEFTAALVTSRHAAAALVGRAAGLAASPQVADALADGRIDTARADVLVSYEAVPVAVRLRVAPDLVGTAERPGPATGLTPAQLRDRLRRAAIESDPNGATRRAEEAVARRHVWIDPAPDQMAWLTALLPAADAARLWARLDATSRDVVRAAGETRTLAQVRADTLTDLVIHGCTGARIEGPADDRAQSDRVQSDRAESDRAASRAAASDTAESDTSGAGCSSAVRTVVNVTVAATTLLGADEAPGHLAGYGPITAPLARALAAGDDATWRRILTDPATGAATDVSRTTYRPGVVLGDLVRTRDATCTFPGCRVPAARCDLDHVEPFDSSQRITGQTCAANLHPVCRAHHNAKTHGGWQTRRDEGGGITWSAPSGHDYTAAAHPTDPAVPPGPTTRRASAVRTTSRQRSALPDDDPPY